MKRKDACHPLLVHLSPFNVRCWTFSPRHRLYEPEAMFDVHFSVLRLPLFHNAKRQAPCMLQFKMRKVSIAASTNSLFAIASRHVRHRLRLRQCRAGSGEAGGFQGQIPGPDLLYMDQALDKLQLLRRAALVPFNRSRRV